MVFAGHDLIAENGTLLAEVKPFAGGPAETELDCQRMESERARNTSFEPSTEGYQTVEFDLTLTDTCLLYTSCRCVLRRKRCRRSRPEIWTFAQKLRSFSLPFTGAAGAWLCGSFAVSYTHLDVYKRQGQQCTSCPCVCWLCSSRSGTGRWPSPMRWLLPVRQSVRRQPVSPSGSRE